MEDREKPATKQDVATLRSDTKQDIETLRSDVKQDIETLRSEMKELRSETRESAAMLRAEMRHVADDLKEAFRDAQTEMLKAFYSYAQSTDLKLNDAVASDANLRDRLSVVERRLTELERKVNFPQIPPQ